MFLRDTQLLPEGCSLPALMVSLLPPEYTGQLGAVDMTLPDAKGEMEDALANVFESELIFAEFERAVFTFVRWCGEEARPWDPPPPPPAETEGEEGAAVGEDEPHPEAPPPAEGEAGEEGGEEGAEAAVEAEPEEPPPPPDLLRDTLLPKVASRMMASLEGLASAA